uniref:Uncharacterized protein n=1 Tax=Caenorhabditis japonica TaxID=281687 RepID=A0A8R1ELG0_CAEJA
MFNSLLAVYRKLTVLCAHIAQVCPDLGAREIRPCTSLSRVASWLGSARLGSARRDKPSPLLSISLTLTLYVYSSIDL